jgi:hypothetical protein
MISLSVAIRIWVKTVAMNAFLWGIWSVIRGNIWEAFGSVLLFLGGFLVTLPLLMIIVPLVDASTLLPYSIPAKIAWLTFYLIVMIILFYRLIPMVDSWAFQLTGFTIGGLLIAVVTTRKSLNKLYKTT